MARTHRRTRPWLTATLLALVVGAAILMFILWFVPQELRRAHEGWVASLELRVAERERAVEDWVANLVASARVVAAFPTAIKLVKQAKLVNRIKHASPPNAPSSPALVPPPTRHADADRDEDAASHFAEILRTTTQIHGYDDAALLGLDGRVLSTAGAKPPAGPRPERLRELAATSRPSVMLERADDGQVMLVALVPILGTAPERDVRGAVALWVDPRRWLFPFLESAPFRKTSAESYLLTRDLEGVLYLSPLRLLPASPLTVRRPWSPDGLFAVAGQAHSGPTGRYLDYRGIAVLGANRQITGTPWRLVVKLDADEAMAGAHADLRGYAIVWFTLLAAVVALTLVLWWNQRRAHALVLAREQQRLVAVLDQAGDAILFVDRTGLIEEGNRRAKELYGPTLRGKAFAALSPPGGRAQADAQLRQAFSTGSRVFEGEHVLTSGVALPVEVSARVAQSPTGELLVAVMRDLSERKAAEARSQRLNRLLRTITEVSGLMVRNPEPERLLVEVCRITVEEGGFAFAWLGWPEADGSVSCRAWAGEDRGYLQRVQVRHDDSPAAHGPTGTALRERRAVTVQNVETAPNYDLWRAAASSCGYRSAAAVPIFRGEQLLCALSLYSAEPETFDNRVVALAEELAGDVGLALQVANEGAERARAEDELRSLNAELEERVDARTQALLDANRELEAFSYSVSHDLRAPLRAIDGFSRLLVEGHATALGEEGTRLLQVVRDNTTRMEQLIDELLTLSRAGRQALCLFPANPAKLINTIFSELRALEPYTGETELRLGELPDAPVDAILFRQVWENLLSNALKFSSKRTRREVVVEGRASGETVLYSVRDNGAGFDPRFADKLFGVFQRLHPAREFAGTGVGLALVQRIVERHRGRVWAESRPDQGATFFVELPLHVPDNAA